jgi:nuclear-control-of-ATPase protein 2
LTRREVFASKKELLRTRDAVARRIGILASDGPRWTSDSLNGNGDLNGETARLYGVICTTLEIHHPPPPSPATKRTKSISTTPPNGRVAPSPAILLAVLNTHLPRSKQNVQRVLSTHHRPTGLTRFWFPLLFLPPALYTVSSLVVRNKAWMQEQVGNAKDTVKGFFVSWVWEPVEGIIKTMRGGGEGLGVAPTTVKSDQEVSLSRRA